MQANFEIWLSHPRRPRHRRATPQGRGCFRPSANRGCESGTNRIFAGCNNTSVIVDAGTGKIVATIKNGTRVDALGWDPSKKLIYIPNGGEGNVTVVHQDSADKYSIVATVDTFPGAKTIAVDTKTHNVYLFQPERGPVPAAPAGATPPEAAGGRGRGPQGPVIASWFIVIKQTT